MPGTHKITSTVIPIGILIINLVAASCTKLVEVDPPVDRITEPNVYKTDATAIAAITGLYARLSSTDLFTPTANTMSLWAGLSADEFEVWNGVNAPNLLSFYHNNLSAIESGISLWTNSYELLYTCNSAIQELSSASSNINPVVRDQLLGEAKFMRAYFYFYLSRFFGSVPLVTTTGYENNSFLGQSSADEVLDQVILDLEDAKNLLASDYLDGSLLNPSEDRVRPNKWVAMALLSRAYLYRGQWMKAEAEASAIIANTDLFALEALENVFVRSNAEAIWQLQPVNSGPTNTTEGYHLIITETGPNEGVNPVVLSKSLLNSFELNDNRRNIWVDSVVTGTDTFFFPYKYKVNELTAQVSEFSVIFRLAEQYLVRAEARAQQGNIDDGVDDLDIIRSRAGLPNSTASTQAELFNAILQERRIELFSESGHRWLDLIRTNRIDDVMNIEAPKKGSTWSSYQQLYPIPSFEIQRNYNLVQNTGY